MNSSTSNPFPKCHDCGRSILPGQKFVLRSLYRWHKDCHVRAIERISASLRQQAIENALERGGISDLPGQIRLFASDPGE